MSAPHNVYTTKFFQNSPQQLVAQMFQSWLSRYGWVLVIPMAVCGALAVFRWEWIVVGLIVLLLVYPFVLAMLYFNHAMRPETRIFIRPLRLVVTKDKMVIEFEETNETKEIPWTQIRNVSMSGKKTIIRFVSPKYSSLTIDDNAWESTETISEIKEKIPEPTENGLDIDFKSGLTRIFEENGIKFA